MFNTQQKKQALELRENEIKKYNSLYADMLHRCENLYAVRCKGIETITQIQSLVSSIAKTPKEFTVTLEEVQKEKIEFKKTEQYVEENKQNMAKAGTGIVAGVGVGTAVAAMTPTVAMGIATTFGTASTGTAISALSGAVQAKAALAWLGGGALAKGGAGIAGGKALLALAGPIGWGIAATAVGISLFSLSKSNENTAQQVTEEAEEIAKRCFEVESLIVEVEDLYKKTDALYQPVVELYERLQEYRERDYKKLSKDIRLQFGTLVNSTLTLAKLANVVL